MGLKFLFCLSRSVISTETEEDERFSRLLSSSWQADPYCSLLSSETEGRSRGGSTRIQAEDDSGNVLYIIIRRRGLNLYLSLLSTIIHTVTQSYQPLDLWDRVIMGIHFTRRQNMCLWLNKQQFNQSASGETGLAWKQWRLLRMSASLL